MATKKTTEQLIMELKELFLEREIKFLNKALSVETKLLSAEEKELANELDKEELKFLKNTKSRLKYIETLHNQMTGKTGKEKTQAQEELWDKILGLQSSVGEIVRSIPKSQEN